MYLFDPPPVTSNIPEGLGMPSPISRKQAECAGTKSPRCQDGRQTPLHFLMVGYLLSCASSLAEGGVL